MTTKPDDSIDAACDLLRRCNESCLARGPFRCGVDALSAAATTLKSYLEAARSDGKPILELDIASHLLATPEGMRWVMPFVLSAESMEASRRRSKPSRAFGTAARASSSHPIMGTSHWDSVKAGAASDLGIS
jgi:hypothetical protein